MSNQNIIAVAKIQKTAKDTFEAADFLFRSGKKKNDNADYDKKKGIDSEIFCDR